MTIDSHVHYGTGSAWGDFSPEFLLDILDDTVDFAICSNLEGIDSVNFKNEEECNLDMIRVCRKYPKLKALAVCEVNQTTSSDCIKHLLETYPEFIGLKFHPECMKLPADSSEYDKYLELAREFKKPCLYHSGHIKSRFSSPKLIYKKAKQFPDVPIILGHLSTGPTPSHEAAIDILVESIEQETATLYTDVSWMDFGSGDHTDTIKLIEALKYTSKGNFTHRILWASDAPVGEFNQEKYLYKKNLEVFKAKILDHFKDIALLNSILTWNAKKLYNL